MERWASSVALACLAIVVAAATFAQNPPRPVIVGSPIAISPVDPSFVIAARGNDLIVSRDGGTTWTNTTAFGSSFCGVYQMVITGRSAPRVFLTYCFKPFYSDDLGESWAPLRVPVDDVPYFIFPNPFDPDEVVIRAGSYHARTPDLGATWQEEYDLAGFPTATVDWRSRAYFRWFGPVLQRRSFDAVDWSSASGDLPSGTEVHHVAGGGRAVFAVTDAGFFRSADQGASWVNTLLPPPVDASGRTLGSGIDIGASEAAVVYAWTSLAMYRSEDGGVTWTNASSALGVVREPGENGLGTHYLTPAPDDGRKAFGISSNDLVRTLDGGATFGASLPSGGYPLVTDGVRAGALYFGPHNSTDGGRTWTFQRMRFDQLSAIQVIFARGPWLLGEVTHALSPDAGGNFLVRSLDGGNTWTYASYGATTDNFGYPVALLPSPDGSTLLGFANGSNCGLASTICQGYGVLLESRDQGANWSVSRSPGMYTAIVQPNRTGRFIAAFIQDQYNPAHITTPDGLASSTDARSWSPLSAAGLPRQFVRTLGSTTESPWAYLFAALDSDTLPTLYRSGDLGSSFNASADGLPPVRINAIASDPSTPTAVFVGTNGAGIFRSLDSGATWKPLPAGVYDPNISMLAFDSGIRGRLYAATNAGPIAIDTTALPASPPVAVEYFYSGFGHYFITAFPEEIAALDAGTVPGWIRTGETFAVDAPDALGVRPVCRFFSASFAPKSSHFYTPYTQECAVLKAAGVWQPEGIAFGLRLRGPDGSCPPTYRPLYRLYNNGMGGAPNHRYTVKPAVVQTMQSNGWTIEGDATTSAFACVPAQS